MNNTTVEAIKNELKAAFPTKQIKTKLIGNGCMVGFADTCIEWESFLKIEDFPNHCSTSVIGSFAGLDYGTTLSHIDKQKFLRAVLTAMRRSLWTYVMATTTPEDSACQNAVETDLKAVGFKKLHTFRSLRTFVKANVWGLEIPAQWKEA